jgi:hypothetical protein
MSQEEFYVWYVFHVVHVDGLLEVLSLLLSIDIISTAGFYMAPFVHCRCSPAAPGGDPLSLSLSLSVSAALFRTSPNTENTHTSELGKHRLPWRERWIQHRGVVYTLFDVFSYPHTHTHTHTQRYRDAKDLFNCGCFGFIRLFQKRQR